MKLVRRLAVALLLLAPAVALAGDAGRADCCPSPCCPDCDHCPFR